MVEATNAFGVSASSISNHIIEVTSKKLKEFQERDLLDFKAFAIFIDTILRGGEAFMVTLGIDTGGRKQVLGFWEGATENHKFAESYCPTWKAVGLSSLIKLFGFQIEVKELLNP